MVNTGIKPNKLEAANTGSTFSLPMGEHIASGHDINNIIYFHTFICHYVFLKLEKGNAMY